MPQLTFPITADGLNIDVKINVDGGTFRSLLAAGEPMPTSVLAKGLIDTGTDITGVGAAILQSLAIPLHYTTTTQGIGGSVAARLFMVTLFILDASQPHLPWLVVPDLLVMELPMGFRCEVLIGLDILRTCKMLVDGPASRFTLDF
jgi:hypothetical protein